MRDGTRIRVHASTLPGADITMLQVNGVNAIDADTPSFLLDSTPRPTYTYEPRTDSYVVTIPKGTGKEAKITFEMCRPASVRLFLTATVTNQSRSR